MARITVRELAQIWNQKEQEAWHKLPDAEKAYILPRHFTPKQIRELIRAGQIRATLVQETRGPVYFVDSSTPVPTRNYAPIPRRQPKGPRVRPPAPNAWVDVKNEEDDGTEEQ